MKNSYNTLLKYIFNDSVNIEYRKETIDGLFRAILEPVISNQKFEACILLKLNSVDDKQSILKRLVFTGANIFSYSDKLNDFGFENIQERDIWINTEFVVILGQRYSAVLLWDSNSSDKSDYASVSFMFNSKIISDIAKTISDNSKVDLKEYVQKYVSERRENSLMNRALQNISTTLNEKNEEILFSEQEKKHLVSADDTLKTAEIVSEKSRFIAHEIKNCLSIINLYSKIIEKRLHSITAEDEVFSSISNSLKNIVNASENVSSLISDLRCLSTPYVQELNIKNLILNTVAMCQEKADSSGVNIQVAKFDDYILSTDKTKFQCALTNLIFNAVEASSSGCEISIDLLKETNHVKVFVKNNGEKITDDIKDKIFQSDFTTKEKGNGLGLAICKQQMQMLGGDINLVNSNDVETLFEIVLSA
ncbi:MAG: HAMP domain-containing histidine kinase [Candidatus Gastranaerophilales bacterium]|nr:HAMP domain-containing histidine kinase [Candidatus Gastranaerophilales bacterium]